MEEIADIRSQLVVLCMNVQSIKSLSIEGMIDWSVPNDPGPTALFLPQAPEALDEMDMRLRPLLDNTPLTKELIPTGAEKNLAKKTSIRFKNGMTLWVLGSHPRNLQRRSLRRVFIDEAWQWEKGRIGHAIKRTTAFKYLAKVVVASQGSDEDHDFNELWQTTDMGELAFLCPKCKFQQTFDLTQLKFDPTKDEFGIYDYVKITKGVQLECVSCKHRMEDTDEMRARLTDTDIDAEFVPSNPNAPSSRKGFRVNALATMSWGELIEEWLRAKVISYRGDFVPLREFHMQRLASFFTDAVERDFTINLEGAGYTTDEDPDEWEDWDEAAISMTGGLIKVAPGPASKRGKTFVRLRLLTVDVQRDHFWYVIRSYEPDGRSRLLRAGKLFSWNEIASLREQFDILNNFVFIDSGDRPFAEVYPFSAKHDYTCLRGDQKLIFQHAKKHKNEAPIQRFYGEVRWVDVPGGDGLNARVHHFSALNCRDMLQSFMKMPERWQLPDDLAKHCTDYADQINSQARVKNKNGRDIWKTINTKAGEHLADCEVMQVVGGLMLKIHGAEVPDIDGAPSVDDAP